MADSVAQLIAAIERQTQILESIHGSLTQPKLGLHSDSGVCYLYCNRQHGSLWYTLNNDRIPQPVTATVLTGYLTRVEFPEVERRGKKVYKLQATIRADRPYLLEAGYESHFAKGLLSAAASLTPQQIRLPITISPQAGDDESVLFCRVFQNNELVFAPYSDETDWKATAGKVLQLLRS